MLRLRQMALVARDLEAQGRRLAELLSLGAPYRDPGVGKYGLDNLVFALPGGFIEIVSPNRPGTTAGRLLDKRGGDGGYMVILQTDDLEGARARVDAAGVRVADAADHDGAAFTHLHPKDVGGAIVSVDRMTPESRWAWAGPDWESRIAPGSPTTLLAAEVQTADPDRTARRWAETLGPDARLEGRSLHLTQGTVAFVEARDGRGEGVSGFTLRTDDPGAVLARADALGLSRSADVVEAVGVRIRLSA